MPSPLRVLIVEDQPVAAERLVEELRRWGASLTWRRVDTEAAYLAAVRNGTDVVLARYALPQFGALQALHLMHEHGIDVPVIVVTGPVGDEFAVECMKLCASDYLLDEQLGRLGPAVSRAVELKRARDAKREADHALRLRTAELSHAIEALARQSDQLRALTSELALAEHRERRRLAELLHDGLQHLLLAARIRMLDLEHHEQEPVREASVEVIDLLEEAMENSRSLTAELSPPILYTGGLVPALQWLCRWMGKTHKLKVLLQADGSADPILDESTKVLLFNAVRELLLNTVKHARVDTAQVEVAHPNGEVCIRVCDSGVGFDPAVLRMEGGTAGGFGLFSIRQRLELLGGRIDIQSVAGGGSRLSLSVPLRRSAGDAKTGGVAPRSAARKIRVLVVNADLVARRILAGVLQTEPDIEVVGDTMDARTAVDLVRAHRPDVVTMDLTLPEPEAVEATRRICAECPATRVIGVALFEQSDGAEALRAAGAVQCLTQCGPSAELIAAIRSCAPEARSSALTIPSPIS